MVKEFSIKLAGLEGIASSSTLVMGILNATPDSFSDGGELVDQASIERRVNEMVEAGVDIIDIGGESTRPGHDEVSTEEEIKRVLPVLSAVRRASDKIPVSIDTKKAQVASEALASGANFINDVSGLSEDEMGAVVCDAGCSIVLMQGYDTRVNSVEDCRQNIEQIILRAEALGVKREQIIVDPGIGFVGPEPKLNLELIRNQTLYNQSLPVLIGASRKRFIGQLTEVDEAKNRVIGSVAAAVIAAERGAAIVRVHDVRETIEALKVVNA